MVSPADVLSGLARAPGLVGLADATVTLVPSPRPFELVLPGSADVVAGTADVVAGIADVPGLAAAARAMVPVHILASTLHPKPELPIHLLRIHTCPKHTNHDYHTTRPSYPTCPRPLNSTVHYTTQCRDLFDSHETTIPDGWIAAAYYCTAFGPDLNCP